MKISFHGACREVTGSCILVETSNTRFLVDCGMFQDNDSSPKNFDDFGFSPKTIDFVLLTHAHIDHCGRLPRLYNQGFRGKVYATSPTLEISKLMLLDSANVFLKEEESAPLYFDYDVYGLINHFSSLDYGKEQSVSSNVRIKLRDAGHVLGSSIFEVFVKEQGKEKKLVFSGDLGNVPAPIVRDTELINGADFVFIESTYGNIIHEPRKIGREKLKQAIEEVIEEKGVLMIPVFALERTQEMIFELKQIFEKNNLSRVPVFVDSPLAIKVTDVYRGYEKFFDEEAMNVINKGFDIFSFNNLKYIRKAGQSKKINKLNGTKIIMAGSGMCDGGRIGNYLKKNLGNAKNQLLFVSFQVEGTLGRKIVDRAKEIEIDGKRVKVKAKVSKIPGFSSHADQIMLMNWLKEVKKPKPKLVYIVHGEEESSSALGEKIGKELRLNAIIPDYNKEYKI